MHAPDPDALPPAVRVGCGVVAVRIDPEDHSHIELDLQTDPPAPPLQPGEIEAHELTAAELADIATIGVTANPGPQTGIPMHKGKVTGEEILATGTPCRATLLSATPLNMHKEGVGEVYGIVMSVVVGTVLRHARLGDLSSTSLLRQNDPEALLAAVSRALVTAIDSRRW